MALGSPRSRWESAGLSPAAWMRTSNWFEFGVGVGGVVRARLVGGPYWVNVIAFMLGVKGKKCVF